MGVLVRGEGEELRYGDADDRGDDLGKERVAGLSKGRCYRVELEDCCGAL
jgi:hypothetical protein